MINFDRQVYLQWLLMIDEILFPEADENARSWSRSWIHPVTVTNTGLCSESRTIRISFILSLLLLSYRLRKLSPKGQRNVTLSGITITESLRGIEIFSQPQRRLLSIEGFVLWRARHPLDTQRKTLDTSQNVRDLLGIIVLSRFTSLSLNNKT